MDALFFFRHSRFADLEIQYALRGIARHAPWIRKVWVFGDRPEFLCGDRSLIEHVPHEGLARIGGYQVPITNFFLMLWVSSHIPDLSQDILWFCDDFILLSDLSPEEAKKDRYVEDLGLVKSRGRGKWKGSLWRTFDFLTERGYTGYNFETHLPTYFTRKRITQAWCEFRDFVTEDRWYGLLGPTAILNHAVKHDQTELVDRNAEGRWVGFHHKSPTEKEVRGKITGEHWFLNFDDDAFALNSGLRPLLVERFPDPCRYESPMPESYLPTNLW